MHAVRLLHRRSRRCLGAIHARRLEAVWAGVEGLLEGEQLWLTALGRHVGGTSEKHGIKRIDQLLGNGHLQLERKAFYGWMGRLLLRGCRNPVMVVDGCELEGRGELKLLRAAVAVRGRALPVYEELHEVALDTEGYRRFLSRLSEILGPECRPVLVTDAGFRAWWYELVEARGWWYVGRVRNREYLRWETGGRWFPNKRLHIRASARAKLLGALWLCRSRPMKTQFYLYRGKAKGRMRVTLAGERSRSTESKRKAARGREPWLLVSNLPQAYATAKRVVSIYRTRMQIEESFRDLKAPRCGFAMREHQGRDLERTANLLLIAALGVLATWLTGQLGYARKLHRKLQANTERRRRVLSTFFVGRRLLSQSLAVTARDIRDALVMLRGDIRAQLPA
jgi:hypothetical protein